MAHELPPVKSMQVDMNKSPSTFEYEIKASASSTSPNLPSVVSAMPPTLIRISVASNLRRPREEILLNGSAVQAKSPTRYDWGRISQVRIEASSFRVKFQ